jgi:transcriptional regulator with XRE-family HTH domain
MLSTTSYRPSVNGPDNPGMPRDVGVRLRTARKLRGMTQQQLAKDSGVSQATISDLETGESKSPTGTNLVSLAQSLEVSPEWLADGKGDMERLEDPLPVEAVRMAREWLKLSPEARTDVAKLIHTMVRASSADLDPVPDERVAAAYGKPGRKKRVRNGSRNQQGRH